MTDQNTPGPEPGQQQTPPGSPPAASATTTEPPPGPTRQRPTFRRSSTDKVIGGVAGGLARTFDQDPVVVRIIVVVLALALPPAFIAYLAAWLLVARDDEPSHSTTGGIALRESGGVLFWVGVAVLVAALFAAFDPPFHGGFNLLPLVLIGIGVALWTRDGAPSSGAGSNSTPTSRPATPTTGAATAPPAADGTTPPAQPPGAQPTAAQPAPAGPPPPPRSRSPLGAITLGVALIATGAVAALDQVPGVPLDADPSHLAAVALLVLGLGQLVGALWGRARWLTLVALFLIPPVLVGTAIREVDGGLDLEGISLGDGVGERIVLVEGDDDLPRDVGLAAGNLEVDLRDWTPDAAGLEALEGDDDMVVDVGAGEVTITTPTDVPWRLVGEVRIGEVRVTDTAGDVDRTTTDDVGTPLDVELAGGPEDGEASEVLDIVVDIRLGKLHVIIPAHDAQELS